MDVDRRSFIAGATAAADGRPTLGRISRTAEPLDLAEQRPSADRRRALWAGERSPSDPTTWNRSSSTPKDRRSARSLRGLTALLGGIGRSTWDACENGIEETHELAR